MAKRTLDELISRAPSTANLYIQQGVAEFGLGNVEASIADLETAATLSPQFPVSWRILARVHDRTGDPAGAAAAHARASSRG